MYGIVRADGLKLFGSKLTESKTQTVADLALLTLRAPHAPDIDMRLTCLALQRIAPSLTRLASTGSVSCYCRFCMHSTLECSKWLEQVSAIQAWLTDMQQANALLFKNCCQ